MFQNTLLNTADNEVLRITLYGNEHFRQNRFIVFVHGFKGFKDWGFGPYLANYLADRGFTVITFNFSHNGIGEDQMEFSEFEKFANNTYSLEISELRQVVEALSNGYFGEVNNPAIGLLGHSRGGAISILTAQQFKDIKAVALWASISHVDRYSPRQKEQWRAKGFLEMINTSTKQKMHLNVSLLDDVEVNSSNLLNINKAVKSFDRPLFIAHGEQDLAVPIREAEELYELSDKKNTEFYRMPATGHTFDIKHPFEGSNQKFDALLNKTCLFFEQHLVRS